MPNQRCELHHKICNLRYGTHGYWRSAYKERWRQNSVRFKCHSFYNNHINPHFLFDCNIIWFSQHPKHSHPQTVKETIGVGVNEKAALSSDKNCPFVYINFDFTLVNKVASL